MLNSESTWPGLTIHKWQNLRMPAVNYSYMQGCNYSYMQGWIATRSRNSINHCLNYVTNIFSGTLLSALLESIYLFFKTRVFHLDPQLSHYKFLKFFINQLDWNYAWSFSNAGTGKAGLLVGGREHCWRTRQTDSHK